MDGDAKKPGAISFSLFGNTRRYLMGAMENLRLVQERYPGWDAVFHIEKGHFMINRLRDGGGVIVEHEPEPGLRGTLWRFESILRPDLYERVCCRDIDSRIIDQECVAVADWIERDTLLHMMRTSNAARPPGPLFAGLFGMKTTCSKQFGEELGAWKRNGSYRNDEVFLNRKILPLFRHDMTVHQSHPNQKGWETPYPEFKREAYSLGAVVRALPPTRQHAGRTERTDRMWVASESWEGPDGTGSLGPRAARASEALREAIEIVGARSVLDAGCGSCAWQRNAMPDGVTYQGVDIRMFDPWPEGCSVLDIVEGPLPEADLIVVRDVFIYLSDEEVGKLLANARASSRYLFSTTNAKTVQFVKRGTCRTVKTADFVGNATLLKEFENYFDLGNPDPKVVHHHQLWDLRPELGP